MKKVLFGVSVLILAGCNSQTPTPQVQTQDQAQSEYQEMASAMASGKPVRCVMTNAERNETITYLVKDKKVRLNTVVANDEQQSGNMLMDGEYIFTWSDVKKEGTKFKVPEETTEQPQEQEVPDLSQEEDRKEYEDLGYTIDCEGANVADSEFIPPSDVTFTDMSQMMDQAQKQQESMSPEDRAQFEKMMQQYAQ